MDKNTGDWQNISLRVVLWYPHSHRGSTSTLVTLREISGTCWLTWVSQALVSRLTRIISSIDPTVANFQVNDPDLCEIHRDENHNLLLSLLLNLLYHWEVSVRISTLTLRFHRNLSYFLFILHCYERIYIYIYHVGYVCSVHISMVLSGYITNLLTFKATVWI